MQSPSSGSISGTVRSARGPEAGVWVIAETDELKTKLRKIVVTDDRGRYLLPELPAAAYRLWVRGYGLADSTPVTGRGGQSVDLTAVVARTPQEAAQVYPASYWLSLLEPPKDTEFPGTGPSGNGISPNMKSLAHWVNNTKGCQRCHQLGSRATRAVPDLEGFASSTAAWDDRVQRGQRGPLMNSFMTGYGRARGLKMFADWTDRIRAGEVPAAPPRPAGVERNVVITMWNWGTGVSFLHDEISTDRRNPRVNAGGPIYGVDIGTDHLTIVDPRTNTAEMVKVPVRDQGLPSFFTDKGFKPWRHFGDTAVWVDPANPHNPMMDATGRVWLTTNIRGASTPVWCREGSANKYAKYFPIARSGRQTGYYDPKTKRFELIDTCFSTHHLQFAEDAGDTLYFSGGGGPVVGWLNTKAYDRGGNAETSQGWCPTVVDTNGDGRVTKPWNEPGAAANASLDTRVEVGAYGVIVSPVDGAVWIMPDEFPGSLVRLNPGSSPPETCSSEIYDLPVEQGHYRPRGLDVDRHGVLWAALAGSSEFAAFDRRRCTVFNGPKATGRQCDAGWKFYKVPGPTYKGTNVGADFHYYNWVDQFDTLGLGANVPIANGSNSDSLLALKPDTGEWVTLRVPYPMGFHSRGVDGRIDNPSAGWKGRAIYATYGADAAWHVEGGPKEPGNLVRFQIRPHPLAN